MHFLRHNFFLMSFEIIECKMRNATFSVRAILCFVVLVCVVPFLTSNERLLFCVCGEELCLVSLYRPKSVPSSPMVKRAFSRLGNLTAGWGRSIRKQHSQLTADDKKKWSSSQDCSSELPINK